jgi:hypothetical protein
MATERADVGLFEGGVQLLGTLADQGAEAFGTGSGVDEHEQLIGNLADDGAFAAALLLGLWLGHGWVGLVHGVIVVAVELLFVVVAVIVLVVVQLDLLAVRVSFLVTG